MKTSPATNKDLSKVLPFVFCINDNYAKFLSVLVEQIKFYSNTDYDRVSSRFLAKRGNNFWEERANNLPDFGLRAHLEHKNPADLSALAFNPYLKPRPYSPLEQDNLVHYEIHILHNDLSEESQALLSSQVKDHPFVTLHFYNVDPYLKDTSFYLNKNSHIKSITTYFRFFISEIFKDYDRVLYLDVDMTINADLQRLLDFNFKGLPLAGVYDSHCTRSFYHSADARNYYLETLDLDLLDCLQENSIDTSKTDVYCNAGLLFFNIQECRKIDLYSKLKASTKAIKEPTYQDQDIYNHVVNHFAPEKITWSLLNYAFNFFDFSSLDFLDKGSSVIVDYKCSIFQSLDFRNSLDNLLHGVIFNPNFVTHFAGPVKMWHYQPKDALIWYKFLAEVPDPFKTAICNFQRTKKRASEVRYFVDHSAELWCTSALRYKKLAENNQLNLVNLLFFKEDIPHLAASYQELATKLDAQAQASRSFYNIYILDQNLTDPNFYLLSDELGSKDVTENKQLNLNFIDQLALPASTLEKLTALKVQSSTSFTEIEDLDLLLEGFGYNLTFSELQLYTPQR